MSYSTIRYEVQDAIALLTLNRPDAMNAFTTQMGEEMADAFDRSDADPKVRAMVVTGEGRAFCAGADLSLGAETFNAVATAQAEGELVLARLVALQARLGLPFPLFRLASCRLFLRLLWGKRQSQLFRLAALQVSR